MIQRTTIELDKELLERAKRALGCTTTRATVEEALRRAVDAAEGPGAERASRQRDYFATLGDHLDLAVLAPDEAWR